MLLTLALLSRKQRCSPYCVTSKLSTQMLRFTDTMNLLARLVLVLMLMLSIASCSTTRSVNNSESRKTQETSSLVESTIRDRYDSIYVLHDLSLNTIHDTVWATERITEYRYRYLHDTVLVARTDTLIQKDTLQLKDSIVVNTPPQVLRNKCATKQMSLGQSLIRGGLERVRTWFDCLAYCSLFLVIVLIIIKIK